VLPVAVGDLERDRRSQGQAAAHAGDDVGGIVLDELPSTSAVPTLPPGQVAGEVVFAHYQPGGNTVDDHGEPLAVGFARRQQTEGHAGTDARSNAARNNS